MFITSYKFADHYKKVKALLQEVNRNYGMVLDENNMRVITNAYNHPMSIDISAAISPADRNIVRNRLEALFGVPEGESIWLVPRDRINDSFSTLSFEEFAEQGARYKEEANKVKHIINESSLTEVAFTSGLTERQQEAAIAIANRITTIKNNNPTLDHPYSMLSTSEQEIVDGAVKYCQKQRLRQHNSQIPGKEENSNAVSPLKADASSALSRRLSSSERLDDIEDTKGSPGNNVSPPSPDPSSKVLAVGEVRQVNLRGPISFDNSMSVAGRKSTSPPPGKIER